MITNQIVEILACDDTMSLGDIHQKLIDNYQFKSKGKKPLETIRNACNRLVKNGKVVKTTEKGKCFYQKQNKRKREEKEGSNKYSKKDEQQLSILRKMQENGKIEQLIEICMESKNEEVVNDLRKLANRNFQKEFEEIAKKKDYDLFHENLNESKYDQEQYSQIAKILVTYDASTCFGYLFEHIIYCVDIKLDLCKLCQICLTNSSYNCFCIIILQEFNINELYEGYSLFYKLVQNKQFHFLKALLSKFSEYKLLNYVNTNGSQYELIEFNNVTIVYDEHCISHIRATSPIRLHETILKYKVPRNGHKIKEPFDITRYVESYRNCDPFIHAIYTTKFKTNCLIRADFDQEFITVEIFSNDYIACDRDIFPSSINDLFKNY